MVDITTLTTELVTISALTKVLVDLVKNYAFKGKALSSNVKYILAVIFSVAIALISGTTFLESENAGVLYTGTVAAGLVAALGSNFIHEFMKVLQAAKSLKK